MRKRRNKKGKVSTNKYKFLIVLLSIISLAGVGYIIYDLFLTNLLKKGNVELQNPKLPNLGFEKLDKGKNELDENNETIAFDEFSEKNNEKVGKETEDKTSAITDNLGVKTNIASVKTESRIVVQKFRIFLYKEVGNDLSFYYETFELTNVSEPVLAVFSKLKNIKSEGNKLSFINPKVKLIDYKITPEKTLIINLSKDVNYNSYGGEGILYSIYQIAYTLGSAVGCKDVLVLIEGEEPEYLGGEGIIFDNPINISRLPKINF